VGLGVGLVNKGGVLLLLLCPDFLLSWVTPSGRLLRTVVNAAMEGVIVSDSSSTTPSRVIERGILLTTNYSRERKVR